ncbi:ATP-binding protein [Cohnella lupini]|nr:ATP-binding protein [Cohnella lupini]
MASLLLNKTTNIWMLILFGSLFALSVVFQKKHPIVPKIQIIFLVLFHWYSHMNWCLGLYYILILMAAHTKQTYKQTIPIFLLYILLYSTIRLSYQPLNTYNMLVSIYDFIGAAIVGSLYRYFFSLEAEKKKLKENNNFLVTHDSLTKLLNYEGYVNALQDLINKQNHFVLILIDFQDFKSINNQSISNGNEALVNISLLLKRLFANAHTISRYAGDRFAVTIPSKENALHEISELLSSNVLGFQVTYSMTQFPQESASKEELISIAEEKLFQNKRMIWLKREEDLFRSEKMRAVGELAAGMAHEIRNPLTTIKGFMQLSQKSGYNIGPWFETIMSEITRMNELTAEFLQFSKPNISKMKAESVTGCLDRLLFLTESDAAYRGHKIMLDIADDSLYVYIDRDKMVQVLVNLVRNGLEAMSEPGVLSIRAKREEGNAVVEIEDTGPGIPVSEQAKIFQPFYTTKEEGTGLGLSICQKIAQDHGGNLEIQSDVGSGAVFSLSLPAYDWAPEG